MEFFHKTMLEGENHLHLRFWVDEQLVHDGWAIKDEIVNFHDGWAIKDEIVNFYENLYKETHHCRPMLEGLDFDSFFIGAVA